MIKALISVGTRPEAIKLAPVIKTFRSRTDEFKTVVGLTGQHDELLTQVMDTFSILADFNLRVMKPNQTLAGLTGHIVQKMTTVIARENPDVVVVQGDTTTVFATALAAYYEKTPIAHVESGLQTGDKYRPFPEEGFRRLTAQISDFCFAPTPRNRDNLLRSGIASERIFVTGNTVIDALLDIAKKPIPLPDTIPTTPNIALLTAHRRENFGAPLRDIFTAIRKISRRFTSYHFVYPVHPNPEVKAPAHQYLANIPNVHLLDPLNYAQFVQLMKASRFILTDSGGIQEEAASLNKPILILREMTERQEILEAGGARLVGTDPQTVVEETTSLIEDSAHYEKMARAQNPFGDGHAAQRIADFLVQHLSPSAQSVSSKTEPVAP